MTDALHLDRSRLSEHRRWVLALARRLAFDADIAEDVAQETCVAALERGAAAPRRWWAQVATNAVRQRQRAEVRRRLREEHVARERGLAPAADEAAARLEAQRRVVDAVLALEEPYRETIALRFYEGLSCAEIARRRGVPAATVRSQQARGLAKLRDLLGRDADDDGRDWLSALTPLLVRPRVVPWATLAGVAGGLLVALAVATTALTSADSTIEAPRFPFDHDVAAAHQDAPPRLSPWVVSLVLPGLDEAFPVRVIAGEEKPGAPTVELQQQENGTWSADVAPIVGRIQDWSNSLLLRVVSEHYMPARLRVAPDAYVGRPGAVPRRAQLRLVPRVGTVRGRVVVPDGEHGSGLQAALFAADPQTGSPVAPAISHAWCDRVSGDYELPVDRRTPVWVVGWRGDQGPTLRPAQAAVQFTGDDHHVVDLVLTGGASISGRVVNPPGSTPIPQFVSLVREGPSGGRLGYGLAWANGGAQLMSWRVQTDPEGRFRFGGLEQGQGYLVDWSGTGSLSYLGFNEGLEGRVGSIRVVAPATDIEFEVPLRVHEVRVVGPDGPVPDARALLGDAEGSGGTMWLDDAGFASFESDPDAPVHLWAHAPGYAPAHVFLGESAFDESGCATLRLVPLADATPVSLAVTLEGDDLPSRVGWTLHPLSNDPLPQTLGYQSGLVEPVGGRLDLGAPAPGSYRLILHARAVAWETLPFYLPIEIAVDLQPGDNALGTRFEQGGRLSIADPSPAGEDCGDYLATKLVTGGEEQMHFFVDEQMGGPVGRFVPAGRLISRDPIPAGEYVLQCTTREAEPERFELTATVEAGKLVPMRRR